MFRLIFNFTMLLISSVNYLEFCVENEKFLFECDRCDPSSVGCIFENPTKARLITKGYGQHMLVSLMLG